MCRAIVDGTADGLSAVSSDGRIAAPNLVKLPNPQGAPPSYDAVLLVPPARAGDARSTRALAPLLGRFTVERVRRADLLVDRDRDERLRADQRSLDDAC